ncbi:MAG: hypothetical protein A2283_03065 [Lentisphaerae bacterium RIFOXYA12_FULL_48_11]|nr:MAG: hypothetical protein A2283_03065 [Lentisphaerae bacterium RIFOXYA12_FULL_48_11]
MNSIVKGAIWWLVDTISWFSCRAGALEANPPVRLMHCCMPKQAGYAYHRNGLESTLANGQMVLPGIAEPYKWGK